MHMHPVLAFSCSVRDTASVTEIAKRATTCGGGDVKGRLQICRRENEGLDRAIREVLDRGVEDVISMLMSERLHVRSVSGLMRRRRRGVGDYSGVCITPHG